MTKPTKYVSIAAEIDDLRAALTAVRILADELAHDHLADCEDVRAVPTAISAVVALVDTRAKQMTRVLRRDADAASMWARSNRAVPPRGAETLVVGEGTAGGRAPNPAATRPTSAFKEIETMTTRRALLLVRTASTSEPTAPLLQALRQLAAQRDWVVAGEFVATPTRRKDRDNLVAAVRSGAHGEGVVVVPALGHLGATIREVVLLANDLLGRGWDLVCLTDGLDTTKAEGRAVIVGTLATLAGLDRAGSVERARAALDQARREGRQLGRKRREVPVQRVYAMLSEGKSWREIARLTGIPASTLHAAMKQSEVALQPALSVLEAA